MNNKSRKDKKINKHCMCPACEKGIIHKSDCAVHSEPAERNGECDCLVKKFLTEHPMILDDDIPDAFDKWMEEQ